MNAFKVVLLAGTVAALMSGAARADTVSGGTIKYTGNTDYMTQLGNLSRFNSAAGTLTSVTFTAGYGFESTITVTAITASTGNVSTESAANFQSSDKPIQGILNSLINTAPVATIGTTQLSPTAYDYTGPKAIYSLAAGSSQNYTSNVASTTKTYIDTNANDLSAFYSTATSAATFDIYGQTLTGLNTSQTGGNVSSSQQTIATQTLSILYTYTAAAVIPPTTSVPEPASLALLGAGLIGAGLIRRKSV